MNALEVESRACVCCIIKKNVDGWGWEGGREGTAQRVARFVMRKMNYYACHLSPSTGGAQNAMGPMMDQGSMPPVR